MLADIPLMIVSGYIRYLFKSGSIELNLGQTRHKNVLYVEVCTGELGYDGPLHDIILHMTDDMLGPSPMHIK